MHNSRAIKWLMILLLAGLALSSCRAIKLKLGIGYTVESPVPGTPEAVMQKVLKVLTMRDASRSWARFLPLLHSHERNTGFINTWKTMKFGSMRRIAKNYVLDPSKYSFKVKRVKELPGGILVLYLESTRTDIPTPCKFKRDKKHGNAWRVFSSCL